MVGPFAQCDRPFGVFTHSDTRHPKNGRLLLDATRIRNRKRGPGIEIEKLQITQRFNHVETYLPTKAKALDGIG